jgi:16S rRNA (guanine527-N7)-methyltransferase
MRPPSSAAVEAVLERSRRLGFLGPGSLRVQVEHALGFAVGLPAPPGRFVDLGSGGGVPGLVLAGHWPEAEGVLVDASERRCAFLADAIEELGVGARVWVARARAELAGRRTDLRGRADAVVARGFGPPAVTAECGAPFLAAGGRLVVSEPPDAGSGAADVAPGRADRWPPSGLELLGLVADREWSEPYHYRSFRLDRPCPDTYPRRDGVPAKRPLF